MRSGKVIALSDAKASGWAVHPLLADYPVLVHVIFQSQIIRSVIADQPAPPNHGGEHEGRWFTVGLAEFEFTKEQLATLTFRVGETDEELLVDGAMRAARPCGTASLTVEQIISSAARRDWINGATFADGEAAGLSDATIIDLLYRDILGRSADPPGLSGYLSQRQAGLLTFNDLRKSLVESDEYRNRRKHASNAIGAIFSQKIALFAATAAVEGADEPPFKVGVASRVLAPPPVDVSLPEPTPTPTPAPAPISNPPASIAEPHVLDLPLDSPFFGAGWHNYEVGEFGAFRWMERVGLIFNPRPELPLAELVVDVSAVYGAHEPMLHISFNETPVFVSFIRVDGGFRVTASPHDRTLKVSHVRIDSLASGCPLQDDRGSDERLLSISVTGVRWSYGL